MQSDILALHPELLLAPKATLRDAMAAMQGSRIGIALVVDKNKKLLGIVNDSDLRKSLLRDGSLDAPVEKAMNPKPISVPSNLSDVEIARVFQRHPKSHLPIVDEKGNLVGLAELRRYSTILPHYPNWVILMAGGQGKRLGPLTQTMPKPMLPLGNKPILEILMEQFKNSGFSRFMISVNHMANQITDYFGDGSRWGVKIEYLRESRPRGTVGGLHLIRRSIKEPLLVANGDILTKVNFGALLEFHQAEKAAVTLCVKRHETRVPYGVVEIREGRLKSFVEKPLRRDFINAGIYVLDPKVLPWIPASGRFDIPDLIAAVRKHRKNGVACFPIEEYWLDIGELESYRRASGDYPEHFQ